MPISSQPCHHWVLSFSYWKYIVVVNQHPKIPGLLFVVYSGHSEPKILLSQTGQGKSGICLTDIHEAQTATFGGCPGSRPNFFKLRLISTTEPWLPDCTLKHFHELRGTLQIHWIFKGNSDISQMTREPPAGGRQLTISTLDPDMPFKTSYFCNWDFRSYGKM